MEKDKNGVVDVNKENKKQNIIQIILDHEMVYIIKLIVFIFAALLIRYDIRISIEQIEATNETHHMFASLLVFLMTTIIDEFILFHNCRLKDSGMRRWQAVFMVVLFIAFMFVLAILIDICPASWRGTCYACNFVCCISPVFELWFDLTYRFQNERDKRISEAESEDKK